MGNNTIVVNKRKYTAKEFDFNFLCELSESGIDIQDMRKKIMPSLRVYVAYCMGVDTDIAGEEINQHIINGGTIEDIANVFSEKAENSDFFQAIDRNSEQENKTTASKKNQKKPAEAEISD